MPPGYLIANVRARLMDKHAKLRAKELSTAGLMETRRIRKEIKIEVDAEIEKLYPNHDELSSTGGSGVCW